MYHPLLHIKDRARRCVFTLVTPPRHLFRSPLVPRSAAASLRVYIKSATLLLTPKNRDRIALCLQFLLKPACLCRCQLWPRTIADCCQDERWFWCRFSGEIPPPRLVFGCRFRLRRWDVQPNANIVFAGGAGLFLCWSGKQADAVVVQLQLLSAGADGDAGRNASGLFLASFQQRLEMSD